MATIEEWSTQEPGTFLPSATGTPASWPGGAPAGATRLRGADDLATTLLALAGDEGDTQSPFAPTDEPIVRPATGYCVALEHSDLQLHLNDLRATDSRHASTLEEEVVDRVAEWVDAMEPLLASGYVWIGVWRNPTGDTVEVNATLVTSHRNLAEALGRDQNQHAIYDIGQGTTIPTGGDGGIPFSAAAGLDALHLPPVDRFGQLANPQQ